jgi:hypothetical protein
VVERGDEVDESDEVKEGVGRVSITFVDNVGMLVRLLTYEALCDIQH